MGTLDGDAGAPRPGLGTAAAWSPYVVVAALLLLTRLPWLGIGARLAAIDIGPRDILGAGIGQAVQPFYSPGFVFIAACAVTYAVHRMSGAEIRRSWRMAAGQLRGAAVALVFALPMVRVFIESGPRFSTSGLESMPITLAHAAAGAAGGAWPLFAPWIGALGAFAAGSNTVSNLMFALFQFASHRRRGAGGRRGSRQHGHRPQRRRGLGHRRARRSGRSADSEDGHPHGVLLCRGGAGGPGVELTEATEATEKRAFTTEKQR
jgi:lactate permease